VTITTRHHKSWFGVPVILDDAGEPLDYPAGLRLVFARLGWDKAEVAAQCNVSPRTVEGWLHGRQPEARCLNVLADALADLSRQ
jgi:hypothetical protein